MQHWVGVVDFLLSLKQSVSEIFSNTRTLRKTTHPWFHLKWRNSNAINWITVHLHWKMGWIDLTLSILVENKWCFILNFQVFGNGLDQILSAQTVHDHKAMFWIPRSEKQKLKTLVSKSQQQIAYQFRNREKKGKKSYSNNSQESIWSKRLWGVWPTGFTENSFSATFALAGKSVSSSRVTKTARNSIDQQSSSMTGMLVTAMRWWSLYQKLVCDHSLLLLQHYWKCWANQDDSPVKHSEKWNKAGD